MLRTGLKLREKSHCESNDLTSQETIALYGVKNKR